METNRSGVDLTIGKRNEAKMIFKSLHNRGESRVSVRSLAELYSIMLRSCLPNFIYSSFFES